MDAREVFAGPWGDFVAHRKEFSALLRADGAAEAAKAALTWRKPTRGAWLINLLSRHDPRGVDEALDLGVALAEAHRGAYAGQLRELSRTKARLIGVLVERACELARNHGYVAPEAVRGEVAETLTAGLADPEVAAAIRAGTMSRTVRAAGFGPADLFAPLADVIPLRPREVSNEPPGDPSSGKDADRLAADLEAAEEAYAAARQEAERRDQTQDEADATAERATVEARRCRQAVEEARANLAAREAEWESARQREDRARGAADAAARSATEGRRAVESAQDVRDALRAEVSRVLGISSGPT